MLRLLSPLPYHYYYCWRRTISPRLPLRGPRRCLTQSWLSTPHYPCRPGAVPVQSCINPAACRSRVFTELLVRCTTVVPPRNDYGTTRRPRLCDCCDDDKVTAVADASSIATDGRVKRLEQLLRPRSVHSSQDGSGDDFNGRVLSLGEESASEIHQRSECSSAHACPALRIRGVLITTPVCSGRLQIKRNQSIIALHWRPAAAWH